MSQAIRAPQSLLPCSIQEVVDLRKSDSFALLSPSAKSPKSLKSTRRFATDLCDNLRRSRLERGVIVRRQIPGGKEIRTIRKSVRAIERALGHLKLRLRKAAVAGGKVRRRSRPLSPKRLAALRLHGRYIGYVRQLRPAQRKQVGLLRAKRGYHAAIARAKRLAGR